MYMSLKINLIALLCLTVLTSNGQYEKLVRGQKVTFDTAVAIQINTYRAESRKLKVGSSLIDSLSLALKSSIETSAIQTKLVSSLSYSNLLKDSRLSQKDSVLAANQKSIDTYNNLVVNLSNRKPTWEDWVKDYRTWILLALTLVISVK